ncbi:acyltransferase family protein [Leptospira neocaledonica]|uniref:Acyltransferase n=1 Tax=Leptospira neocaledonica TaxID=2023192 RepID=A0A2M9ZTG9_9LEPT|nr:acyltransferase [Leptospira neocaledonica]PJZ75408.1 acyltransferase [Leptospira neocaledonica]
MKFLFSKNESEIPALNGLRALSIFLVILYHFWDHADKLHLLNYEHPLVRVVFHNLRTGVDLFFILSGFLIYSGLLQEKRKTNTLDLKMFYIKRTLRIMPAYYLCLIASFFYSKNILNYYNSHPDLHPEGIAGIQKLASTISHSWADVLYISNYFNDRLFLYGWSLSIEEQFYLVIPALCLLFFFKIPDRLRRITLLGLFFLPLFIRFIYMSFGLTEAVILYHTETRFDTLICGMLIAELVFWKPDFLTSKNPKFSYLLGFGAVLFLSFAYLTERVGWGLVFNFTGFHLGYSSLFILALWKEGFINRLFSLTIFRPFSRISYTMYLWHTPCTAVALGIIFGSKIPGSLSLGQFFLFGLFAIIVSFVICIPIFYITERPFLALRDYLVKRMKQKKNETMVPN